jgi:methyl-accepting chemotaxis protein
MWWIIGILLFIVIIYHIPIVEGMECDKEQLPISNAARLDVLKTSIDDIVKKIDVIDTATKQNTADIQVLKSSFAEWKPILEETATRAKDNEARFKQLSNEANQSSLDTQNAVRNNPPLE